MTGHDLRYALRRLRMSPGFAATSVTTLAVAIGVSTAMFSVLNAVVLRPLPYESPDRLAILWSEIPSQGVHEGRSAFGTVEQWRSQSRGFADLAVFDPVSVTLARAGDSEQISVARVSPNLFTLLGVTPHRGRAFSGREAAERQRLAVISHHFWQRHFGGSAAAIGASLQLDGQPSQIIGILPEAIEHAGFNSDVWEPHTLFPDWETRRTATGAGAWFVVGRLRPGVDIDDAQVEMTAIARRLDAQRPAFEPGRGIRVMPFSLHVTGSGPRLVVWLLAGAGLLLLLVAAFNVAGLSVARSAGRVPEMAIRAALGAGRGQIVRLLLTESLAIGAIAGVLGLLLAAASVNVIRAVGPAGVSRLQEVSLGPRVFVWALVVSLMTGVLVGLAPAAILRRHDLQAAGARGGRGVTGGAATRLRQLLVVAECAVAMMLLVVGGLLVRSWWNVMQVDPGFRSGRVLSVSVATPPSMPSGARAAFYDRLVEQVAAVPGIERAGIGSELFVGTVAEQVIMAEGADSLAPQPLQVRRDEVSPAFFDALGTPLLRGRWFSAADTPGAMRVAIINDALASRVWPGRDPVGRRVSFDRPGPDALWFTVVGVVGNMRRQNMETGPVPQLFESLAQNPPRRAILFARTSVSDPLQLAGPLRAAVRRVDDEALAYHVTTVDERLGALGSQRRLQTALLTAFAVVALLLAMMGIYGLIQYSVAMRTQEIGIRMALGARPGDIFRMVVREGLVLSLAGLGLGLLGGWWLGRTATSLLFGVSAADPVTFTAVAALLMAVATAACWLPARRATRVAPIVALQQRAI